MPVDLALSEHNDLIMGANMDYSPIFDTALIEQRIRLRLKMTRGEWIYDEAKTLGSDLRRVMHGDFEKAQSAISALVHQALRPMTDISLATVEVKADENNERNLFIIVNYSPNRFVAPSGEQAVFTAEVQFPI